MMNRRNFATTAIGALAASRGAYGQGTTARTVFYASVGPELFLYEIGADATLTKRASVLLPGNVQYAWPHPSKRYFYVISTNGEPGGGDAPKGDKHLATAFRIDPATGALAKHGSERNLPSRPIHASVDATGRFLLIAFNEPSNIVVHRIEADGSIGLAVNQPQKLDAGIYGHQIRTTPANNTAILITRGNNATPTKPEDPGAIKVFGFREGALSNLQSVAAGNNGLGFGPRHLDFHPTKPWVYVSIERQNQIYMYPLNADGSMMPQPAFVKGTLAAPRRPELAQGAGTIHIHPNGRFAYIPNRAAGTVKFEGKDVFAGGENNIAVFALNQQTGEPTLIQNIDGRGIQLRTFAVHPSGGFLIAASIQPLLVREGNAVTNLSAGLSVYRIGADGKLSFARKYDVDTSKGTQFWSGMVTLG